MEIKEKIKNYCEKVTPEQKKMVSYSLIGGLVGFCLGMLIRRK